MRNICSEQQRSARGWLGINLVAVLVGPLAPSLDPNVASAGPYDTSFGAPKLQTEDFFNLGTPRVALQQDGKVLIHGDGFNRIGGTQTGPLARFNADGTRDSSFAFSQDYSVTFSIRPATNGQIYVNATLASFAGDKETLLRVNADGSVDSSFDTGTGADGNIREITVQPDGRVLVGGLFTTFNGSPYPFLVRLNANGSIDSGFGPVVFSPKTNSIYATGIWSPVVVQPDGKIVVAGHFSAVNGVARDGIARLSPTGSVDMTFAPTGFSVLNDHPVRSLAFQSGGSLIVGGRLALGTNTTRRPLVRLDTNGVADPGFVTRFTGLDSWIRASEVLPDDRIVAVDDKVYRFNADGTPDPGFLPDLVTDKEGNSPALVVAFAVQGDGKIIFAGGFSFVGSQARDGVARLNTDGSLDSFDVGRVRLDSFPKKVFVQTDGKALIATDLTEANGSLRNGLVRLNANGTVDPAFDPAIALGTNTSVLAAALQPDGKICVVFYSTLLRNFALGRLNSDATLDTNFNELSPTSPSADLAALPDGKILLLADRDPDLLASHQYLIQRLNYDGSADNTFQLDPSFTQTIVDSTSSNITALFVPGPRPLLALPGGKLLVASFTTNLQFRLARLNPDGSLDSSFTPGVVPAAMQLSTMIESFSPPGMPVFTAPVTTAENLGFLDADAQPDGKLLVAGQFTNYNGSARNGIVRLNSNGSIDQTFSPGPGPQWVTIQQTTSNLFPRVESVRLVAGNKILIAGNFEAFSGAPFNGVARLNSDGSVDTNFFAGLERRNFGRYPRSPSSLVLQPDGNCLLAGQFSRPGQSALLDLSRLLLRPSLGISKFGSTGPFQLSLTGGADQTYAIQAATNLVNWIGLTNLVSTNDVNSFEDPANLSRRFYRAVSLPGP